MRRLTITASFGLAFFMVVALAGNASARPPHHCAKTFTVHMATRAAGAVYAGTRDVTRNERQMLGRIERCQRNPRAKVYVRWYEAQQRAAWHLRRNPPYVAQVASWYDDSGATACGFHATYGVANKTLACGTVVDFKLGGRTVTAVVDDRGPFISGREWDLSQSTAGALGFDGVGPVLTHVR